MTTPKPRSSVDDLAPYGRLYSIADVAAITGKTYKTIWGWIRAGEMTSKRIRGRHVITAAELERLGIAPAPLNSG